jgi:uncharacterized DUF497 family protein
MDPIVGFDWDEGNREKCQKHGVSIAEIESVFDGSPIFATDAGHSHHEVRARAGGQGREWQVCICRLHDP